MPRELIEAAVFFPGNQVAGVAGEVDVITEDNRARRARARQLRFPGDVLRFAPLDWQAGG